MIESLQRIRKKIGRNFESEIPVIMGVLKALCDEDAIMDILLNHNLLTFSRKDMKEFKKSGKKSGNFCKENLKIAKVKSYDSAVLVATIKKYHEISKVQKGEYPLLDLLK